MRYLVFALYLAALPLQADQLLIVDQDGPQLRRFDLPSRKSLGRTPLKEEPIQLVLAGRFYTLGGQGLVGYDPKTLQTTDERISLSRPIALAQDDQTLYILHNRPLKLTRLRRGDLTVIGEPQSLGDGSPVFVDPGFAVSGDQIWLGDPRKGQLRSYNAQTLQPNPPLSLASTGYLMPMAGYGGLLYVALGKNLYTVAANGTLKAQQTLQENSFQERPLAITQLLVNERFIYAAEPNTQQILVFDRLTLKPQPPLKLDRTLGQLSLNTKGQLLVPCPDEGEILLFVGQSRLPLRVGGNPSQVTWLSEP